MGSSQIACNAISRLQYLLECLVSPPEVFRGPLALNLLEGTSSLNYCIPKYKPQLYTDGSETLRFSHLETGLFLEFIFQKGRFQQWQS